MVDASDRPPLTRIGRFGLAPVRSQFYGSGRTPFHEEPTSVFRVVPSQSCLTSIDLRMSSWLLPVPR